MTDTTTTTREKARQAILNAVQDYWEKSMSRNYHSMIIESDGTHYWSEKINDNECGAAEYYGYKRDYWTLTTVGLGSVDHGGDDADYYETREPTSEERKAIAAWIKEARDMDYGNEFVARESRTGITLPSGEFAHPDTYHFGRGAKGWYVQTADLLHWSDANQVSDDEMMAESLAELDEIPVGFFDDEEPSEEWENMPTEH